MRSRVTVGGLARRTAGIGRLKPRSGWAYRSGRLPDKNGPVGTGSQPIDGQRDAPTAPRTLHHRQDLIVVSLTGDCACRYRAFSPACVGPSDARTGANCVSSSWDIDMFYPCRPTSSRATVRSARAHSTRSDRDQTLSRRGTRRSPSSVGPRRPSRSQQPPGDAQRRPSPSPGRGRGQPR